jgi:hypothetical protein
LKKPVFFKNLQVFSFEKPQVLLEKPAGLTCVEKTCLKPWRKISPVFDYLLRRSLMFRLIDQMK